MTTIASSAFASALALAMLAGSAMGNQQQQATAQSAAPVAAVEQVFERTPVGQCRIVYAELPEHAQPAHMDCEHANWLARSWGGQVMEKTHEGLVERAAYEGRNDFTNVPVSELPRRGYCRAWVDGVAAEAQPEESDCRVARTVAAERGGRVLFMPL